MRDRARGVMIEIMVKASKKILNTGLIRLRQIIRIRPVLTAKLTRHYLCITLPRRFGGSVHLLPSSSMANPLHFTVTHEANQHFVLQMTRADCQNVPLAYFPDEVIAHLALVKLSQAFSRKRMRKWCYWLFLLGLSGWLLNDYPRIHQAPSPSAVLTDKPPLSDAALNQPMQNIVSDISLDNPISSSSTSSPSNPSNLESKVLANKLYQQLVTAQTPPKYINKNGLDEHQLAISNKATQQNLTGCNPNFAFEVPTP